MSRNILYISYDGLCSPLGQSQILPYLLGLEGKGHTIVVLTMESARTSENQRSVVSHQLKGKRIHWYHVNYHHGLPFLSKLLDMMRLRSKATRLHAKYAFDFSHCRSYVAAEVGIHLKRNEQLPFIFDMRGFWADERVEGGLWPQNRQVYRYLYQRYKRMERTLLKEAAQIVSLTQKAKDILEQNHGRAVASKTIVIPCCADPRLFKYPPEETRAKARADLGVSDEQVLFVYHGSVGTWYMMQDMLHWAKKVATRLPDSRFLILTHHQGEELNNMISNSGLTEDQIMVRSANRAEVAGYLSGADLGWFFIRPGYSKQASCPTKLGELLMMGIPVVTNQGVGDVHEILVELSAGRAIDIDKDEELEASASEVTQLTGLRSLDLAVRASKIFSLARGVELYHEMYQIIWKKNDSKMAA